MNSVRYLFFIAITCCSLYAYSQNKVGIPSANNAISNAGGASSEVNVNLYTGTASVGIPLLSLPSQSMAIPVSLQYIGGRGVRVQDYAGEVGLGWKLSASSITRVVRGYPDDHMGTHVYAPNYYLCGGYLNGKIANMNVASYIKNAYSNNTLDNMHVTLNLNGTPGNVTSTQLIDSEPDLFQLTTPSFSVSFTFDENGNPVFQTLGTNLKITHSNFFPSSSDNSSFKVYDGQGTEYYFGSTASSREMHTTKLNNYNRTYISSWYLDKVINTLTQDTITWQYTTGSSVAVDYYSWGGTAKIRNSDNFIEDKDITGPESNTMTIVPKYVSKIESKLGSMEFLYNLPFTRSDFPNYKGLTSVRLKDKSGVLHKEFRFVYQNGTRLMLSAIQEVDVNNSTVVPYREFIYHTRSLPARSSYHQDFFGYYRNISSSITLEQVTLTSISYREALSNPDYAKASVLTKVKYPTGLAVGINYEMNQFFSPNSSSNRYGGGLRVQSISSVSPQDTLTTSYIYSFNGESSGRVLSESFDNLGAFNFDAQFTYVRFFSHIPALFHDLNGIFLGYSKVKVVLPTKDYSIHDFTNHDTDLSGNFYRDMVNVRFTGSVTQWSGSSTETIYSSISRANRRGQPLKEESFTKNDRLMSSVEYEYHNTQSNELRSFGVTAYYFGYPQVNRTIYYTRPEFFHLLKKTTKEYVQHNSSPLTTIVNYEYNNYKLRKTSTVNSKGENVSNTFYYTSDLSGIPRLETGELSNITSLINSYNAKDLPVHTISENVTRGTSSESHIVYDALPRRKKERGYRNNVLQDEVTYEYEPAGHLSSAKETKSIAVSYAYDNDGRQLAEINHAQALYPSNITVRPTKYYEFFYDGFDGASTTLAYSGKGSKTTPYTVPFVKPNNRSYLIDYRYYQNGKWHYIKKPYTNGLIINEGSRVDQVRVYPEESAMTTYTYESLKGISSKTDVNGVTVFYGYDGRGRLSFIKDKDGNVIKTYCYNHVGDPVDCEGNKVYLSAALNTSINKNNCSMGFYGSQVVYHVPKGRYRSILSQADADAQALNDASVNGQAYANANGECIPDGNYVGLCEYGYRQIVNGNYRETYASYFIKVYSDPLGTTVKQGSINVNWSYNGFNHTQLVSGMHDLGEFLIYKEYIGYIPPGQAGQVWSYFVDISHNPNYDVIWQMDCSAGPILLPTAGMLPGALNDMVHFTTLSDLCNYTSEDDVDIYPIYYLDDLAALVKCFTDSTMQQVVEDGYYTAYKFMDSGSNYYYRIIDGVIVEEGFCL